MKDLFQVSKSTGASNNDVKKVYSKGGYTHVKFVYNEYT